jgi:NAD-dependent SIR2 family protein deacetylase
MYLTHVCCYCGTEFERDSVPTENDICDKCYSEYLQANLVTGTPVTEKKPFNLAIFFEWVKLVQRVIMVILTAGLIYVMLQANVEMKGMKEEMQRITILTLKALDIAEVTRLDIMRQIEEIQKDGIDLHLKLW